MKTKVSTIIPTYKRKESLLRLFKSLKPELNDSIEVIIIEQIFNNSIYFKNFAKKNKILLKYYLLDSLNVSKARNIGIKNAQGKYVIFLDDDAIIRPNFFNNHLKNFNDSQIGATTGRVITVGHPVERDKKNVGRISFWGNFTDGFSSKIQQEIDTAITCNACWRKKILNKIGGFDENFKFAIREDSDLSLRTKLLGYKIIFEPGAVVVHLRELTGGARKTEGRMNWYFNFFSNETYFFLKHRPKFIVPIILLTRWQWALRCMFGFGREISIRSISTPLLGIMDGIGKYRRFKNENRG